MIVVSIRPVPPEKKGSVEARPALERGRPAAWSEFGREGVLPSLPQSDGSAPGLTALPGAWPSWHDRACAIAEGCVSSNGGRQVLPGSCRVGAPFGLQRKCADVLAAP